jgi:hypothetical protein
VKTSLLTLLLTALGLWAQTPPAPTFQSLPPAAAVQAGVNTNQELLLKRALQRALESGTNVTVPAVGTSAAVPGIGTNAAVPAVGTNAAVPSIVGSPAKPAVGADAPAPAPASPNQPRPQPTAKPGSLAIPGLPTASVKPAPGLATPPSGQAALAGLSAAAAIASPEEPLPQGMIDFRSADLSQVLEIYSIMVNRTILRPSTLPAPTITLTTRGQLTVREGIQALDAVLALNGIAMVNVADKFVKAVPEATGNTTGARFDTNNAASLPELGQYVTHVVQLKYA